MHIPDKTYSCISIHPPRAGRDPLPYSSPAIRPKFQSTLPVRGGTPSRDATGTATQNFNPPSPCGEGPYCSFTGKSFSRFQSTLPVRGGTSCSAIVNFCHDFNPPSPCGEGRLWWCRRGYPGDFNPPSPCGEGLRGGLTPEARQEFQSTLPVRGGTRRTSADRIPQSYFNPPSPCGEGRQPLRTCGNTP